MKRNIKYLLLLMIVCSVFFVTGCNKDDPTAGFKNPKTIEYTTEKGTIQLTYDDDGTYEEVRNDPYVTLKNADGNFRIDIDYSKNTVEQQKTAKDNFAKDKNYTIIDNVKFRDYEGYIQVDNKYATAIAYLYLDEENDIVSYIKVSAVMSSGAEEALANGTNPEDVFYNQEKVQQILKTVQYVK